MVEFLETPRRKLKLLKFTYSFEIVRYYQLRTVPTD